MILVIIMKELVLVKREVTIINNNIKLVIQLHPIKINQFL
jgi:hypothetical protein